MVCCEMELPAVSLTLGPSLQHLSSTLGSEVNLMELPAMSPTLGPSLQHLSSTRGSEVNQMSAYLHLMFLEVSYSVATEKNNVMS